MGRHKKRIELQVTLLHNTPLEIADQAIGKCWDKTTPEGSPCNVARIERVANKNKHASTIEHLSYNFDIDGVSRALLQELARHRMANLSVKSTRYTLNELRDYDGDLMKFLVSVTPIIDANNVIALERLQHQLKIGGSSDKIKYMLPEAYKTSLTWTMNARALQNFLELRTNKAALWEIRDLAYEVYNKLPQDHKFLFKDLMYARN